MAEWTFSKFDIFTIRGGGSGLKISKTGFKDSGWSKRSTQWTDFLDGFGGPILLGACVVATPIFPPKAAQK